MTGTCHETPHCLYVYLLNRESKDGGIAALPKRGEAYYQFVGLAFER